MSKILIVEDDPIIAKMYKTKFENEGIAVVETAANGEEGLAKMKSLAPDFVLLDLMMPKVDGFEVMDRAKQDPVLARIPIIVLTNLSTHHDVDVALKKGALGYIVKANHTPSEILQEAVKILQAAATKQ